REMNVRRSNILSSRSGVTLLETIVVVSIGTMLTLAVSSLIKAVSRSKSRIEDRLVGMSDEFVGNRQIWFDLRQAGVSFNFLNQDGAACPPTIGDFYDYLPD